MHRLALASRNANAVAPIAIAVGAKNAGKSTLCQLLLNSLLAQRADAGAVQSASREEADGQGRGPGGIVAYLDLDPGQCEFTAAGMISLVVVLDRNQHSSTSVATSGRIPSSRARARTFSYTSSPCNRALVLYWEHVCRQ